MYVYSIYLGPKVSKRGLRYYRPKSILYDYMDPSSAAKLLSHYKPQAFDYG